MKAVVLENPETLVYQEVEKPIPRPGEALLEVKAASICGSDLLRVFHGQAKTYPLILGHECAGQVVEVGPDVDPGLLGQRAAVAPLIPCLSCTSCRQGAYSSCLRYSFIGSRQSGGFAQYLVAPVQNLVPFPATIDFTLSALIEPSTVALHALERGNIQTGQRVAVLGAGSIGLFAIQWARIKGASQIIATDIVEENLVAARELGAHVTLNARSADVAQQVLTLTGAGVDIAVETAGVPQTLEQALLIAQPRGRVVCVGNQPAQAVLPMTLVEHLMRRELEVCGVWMSYSAPFPGHEWSDTIQAALEDQLNLPFMISHRVSLAELPDTFSQMHSGNLRYRKIIVTP